MLDIFKELLELIDTLPIYLYVEVHFQSDYYDGWEIIVQHPRNKNHYIEINDRYWTENIKHDNGGTLIHRGGNVHGEIKHEEGTPHIRDKEELLNILKEFTRA